VTVSNVPDWLDPGATARLTSALAEAVRPGGRVLVRSILTDGGLSAHPAFVADSEDSEDSEDSATANLVLRERTALYGRVELLRRRAVDEPAQAR